MDPTIEGQGALLELAGYFYHLARKKRQNPGDDMLTRLTRVTVERGDGVETQLTDNEIAGFATLLGGAGAETVTRMVANAVVAFDAYPDQWQKIVNDPQRIPASVEETLRFLPPSQYQGRFSLEERSFEGGTIPAGVPVLLLTGAATRDERAFDRPDEFDIDRPPAIAIGFGHGVHTCLGAALARVESRIAIEEISQRWRRLEPDTNGLRRVRMSNVAGYANVPVTAVR
jgi:cytochrome P450